MLKSFGKAPSKSVISKSPNFRGGRFQNPVVSRAASFKDIPSVLHRFITRKVEKAPTAEYVFEETNRDALKRAADGQIHLNWLGHAAVLLNYRRKYFLTDPMLGLRASPFQRFGPKRYTPSPIHPANLPEIEAVILSHDHYDHLDYETVRIIQNRVKKFIVPIGVSSHLLYWGVRPEQLIELDWWEEYRAEDYAVVSAPARHFSGRGFVRDNTLWSSYVLQFGGQSIYFAGDSGFFSGIAEIGDRFGPFDLSLMPIGAYEPAWQDIHLNPEEAVRSHQLVRANQLFPTHWGTFDLSLHSWYEPIQWLTKLADEKGIPLVAPEPGRWVPLSGSETDAGWWKRFSREVQKK